MNVKQLRTMMRATPFQPFEIHLADGRSLPVDHPEMLAITPPGRTVGVGLSNGTIETIDLLLVTSLKQRGDGTPQT